MYYLRGTIWADANTTPRTAPVGDGGLAYATWQRQQREEEILRAKLKVLRDANDKLEAQLIRRREGR